nr:hypothetical protein [Tanacetum cinerariifolium]
PFRAFGSAFNADAWAFGFAVNATIRVRLVAVGVAVHGVGGSITGGGVMEVVGDGDDAGWPLWAAVMEAVVEWWTMEVWLSGMVDLIDRETGIVFGFAGKVFRRRRRWWWWWPAGRRLGRERGH